MTLKRRITIRLGKYWLSIFIVGLVFASGASGYVLQGAHVLDLMAHTLSGAKTLWVEQSVTIDDPDISEKSVILEETLSYAFPDRFRSDTRFGQNYRLYVASQEDYLLVVDGKRQSAKPSRFDRYKDLLLYHSRALLLKAFLNHGIDVGTTSLGRFEDRIVYVIGAQFPDESVSQVWVDKARFLPLRWLDVDPADSTQLVEFVYRKWQKNEEQWYPTQIEVFFQQQLFRLIRVKEIKVNNPLVPDIWDISRLETLYPPEKISFDPVQPEKDVDEVQEVIESFQKKFEP